MTRFLLAFAIAALSLASPAHAVPCFDSKQELLAAHPHPIHYSWTHGRYYLGRPQKHVKCDTKQDTARPDGGMRRTAASGDGRKVDPAGRDTPAAGTNPPPVTTGMNVSAPPPPAVTDWSIRVKTEPAQWPREVSFDPPPLTMTAEQVKAAPVEDDPPLSPAWGWVGRAIVLGGILLGSGALPGPPSEVK